MPAPPAVPASARRSLTDYAFQTVGIDWLRSHPRALLGDEPGLGKTRQLIEAATEPCLVVAPAMVLDGGVWQDEIARWRPDLDIRAVSYASLPARERTDKGGTRPTDQVRPQYAQRWGTVIFDEAHYLKGRKTHWVRAALTLQADQIHLATGTPIVSYAHELYMLLLFLHGRADRRFSSYWRWIDTWFNKWQPPWGGTEILGLKACVPACDLLPSCWHWAEFHRQNLGELYLGRLRDEVVDDLPPLTEQTVLCPMVPAQKRAYKELRHDFVTWVQGGEVAAWNTAVQTVRMAQICTGLESLPGVGGEGSGKLDQLEELMAERTRPTLVLGHFHTTLLAIQRRLEKLGLSTAILNNHTPKAARRPIVQAFQEGGLDVLIGGLGVVSEGLTLHRADTVIFVEQSWRPSTNKHALRRVHRIGQERPVTAIHLITPESVDERMVRVLAKKTDQQMRALRPSELLELL